MRADRFTAFIDANVLVGALTCNVVLTLAEAGFFRPRWSPTVLDETERAVTDILQGHGREDAAMSAARKRRAIERAFPEAAIDGHDRLHAVFDLPDADDLHVAAAALRARASIIVTDNVRHFPQEQLSPFDMEAQTCDEFVCNVIDLDPPAAVAALRRMRLRFARPRLDGAALLDRFDAAGLTGSANLLLLDRANL